MVIYSYYKSDPRPRRAAEALVSAGMNVDLFCLRQNRQEPKREILNGVHIRRIPLAHRRDSCLGYVLRYLTFLLLSSASIAARTLIRRYDLVYVHNMPDFLVLCGVIPQIVGAKVILDMHDPMPELIMTIFGLPQTAKSVRFLKLIEKWSLRCADSVITVNRACAALFASRSCPAQKLHVIMNSPDEGIFQPDFQCTPAKLPQASKPFVIMYHGSLVERNGLELAVEAVAKLRIFLPDVELRIYGAQNPFLSRVMHVVGDWGLESAVRYMGPKSLEEIVQAIKDCDVGIVPNVRSIFTELNTPTRIFEYLSMGKPVIAPRARGICDYFDDHSLIFFELGNAEDLALKIDYVFHHPQEVADIVRRGQKVHRAHSWREERIRLMELVSALLHDCPTLSSANPLR
jgi:glycosyltransferase involved in cell wall biosynthesis